MSQTCLAPTTTNSQIPLLRYHAFLRSVPSVLWFIPKGVSGSADTTGIRALPTPSIQHPRLTLPPHPCLLLHMQRKEASPLWQQQNTTLQKRCAPLTVTIKKGVDRIRAGDDDLRGRDVQKEARRGREKGFLSSVSIFSYLFFIFSGFIKPHLTHV